MVPLSEQLRINLHRKMFRPHIGCIFLASLVVLTVAMPIGSTSRKLLQLPNINYISPFSNFHRRPSFHASPIYTLPLKFLSNAKPMGVLSGSLDASPSFLPSNILEHLPSLSKMFRIPLKYVSNAKPMRVFFKKPFAFLNGL